MKTLVDENLRASNKSFTTTVWEWYSNFPNQTLASLVINTTNNLSRVLKPWGSWRINDGKLESFELTRDCLLVGQTGAELHWDLWSRPSCYQTLLSLLQTLNIKKTFLPLEMSFISIKIRNIFIFIKNPRTKVSFWHLWIFWTIKKNNGYWR